jgi:hypothetical protein
MTPQKNRSRPASQHGSGRSLPTARKGVNAVVTTTVEIETLDSTGAPRHLYHGAMHNLGDALSVVSAYAAAPVNRWVRKRLEANDGGRVQIGQVTAAICVLR